MSDLGGPDVNVTAQPTDADEFPVISDPKEYFETVVNTSEAQSKIEARYQIALANDPTVTREDALRAYSETGDAKKDILSYYETHGRNFKLDRSILSPEFNEALQKYFDMIETIQLNRANDFYMGNQAKESSDDHMRTALHNEAAARLVAEGTAPSINIARQLIHFMTVSAGLEKFDPNKDEKKWRAIANMPMRSR